MPLHLIGPANLRQTRSNRVFSPYKGEPLVVPDPQFEFSALVKQHVQEEDCLAELDAYDPFDSQSPLSTPPSIPPASLICDPAIEILIPTLDLDPPAVSAASHNKWQSKANCKRK
ncbi:hypothetical protein ARMGADRAFT_1089548 [Armillaria gallica]|uniref:Uncharacterized protein n=1 Tax=Armillaria gallica TaxID=47427 RepID=A0A2H3CJJ4_ARMGA|nr:hypothetical protein ARMGADRAFT_1089548 [Armillaria gallica]